MDDAIEKIQSYIGAKNPEYTNLSMDTDIIENRLIDSLQFVEFVLYIEEVAEVTIDMELADIEDFRSLNNLTAFINRLRKEEAVADTLSKVEA